MTRPELSAEYLETSRGRLFVVTHGRSVGAHTCVLISPPFGDEMNKSRHLLAQVARALAAFGNVVVLPDVYGTGDSDGEFANATWERWVEDLQAVGDALCERDLVPNRLVAVRTGALLGLEAVEAADWPMRHVVLWQPVSDGERFLNQFLRLRVAASMTAERRETVGGLRQRLAEGETLEVAGYSVSPALASSLDRRQLAPLLKRQSASVHWFEVVAGREPALSAPAAAAATAQSSSSSSVQARAFNGQPFWVSSELVQAPELVAATIAALRGAS